VLNCTFGPGLTRCAPCAAANRGGPRGCVPVSRTLLSCGYHADLSQLPPSLTTAATRLLAARAALVVGAPGCPSEGEVRGLARALGLRMRGAATASARYVTVCYCSRVTRMLIAWQSSPCPRSCRWVGSCCVCLRRWGPWWCFCGGCSNVDTCCSCCGLGFGVCCKSQPTRRQGSC
jgi:hypothetical protein